MKTFGLIPKIKANKRLILIFLILVSCGVGIYGDASSINKLLNNEEIDASLKMNQLYNLFLPEKKELQSLLSGNKKIGFYSDVLIPQDQEVVLYTFNYLLAPILVDKNYLGDNTILMLLFFPKNFEDLEKQDIFSVVFKKDYDFCKLAVLKKR